MPGCRCAPSPDGTRRPGTCRRAARPQGAGTGERGACGFKGGGGRRNTGAGAAHLVAQHRRKHTALRRPLPEGGRVHSGKLAGDRPLAHQLRARPRRHQHHVGRLSAVEKRAHHVDAAPCAGNAGHPLLHRQRPVEDTGGVDRRWLVACRARHAVDGEAVEERSWWHHAPGAEGGAGSVGREAHRGRRPPIRGQVETHGGGAPNQGSASEAEGGLEGACVRRRRPALATLPSGLATHRKGTPEVPEASSNSTSRHRPHSQHCAATGSAASGGACPPPVDCPASRHDAARVPTWGRHTACAHPPPSWKGESRAEGASAAGQAPPTMRSATSLTTGPCDGPWVGRAAATRHRARSVPATAGFFVAAGEDRARPNKATARAAPMATRRRRRAAEWARPRPPS